MIEPGHKEIPVTRQWELLGLSSPEIYPIIDRYLLDNYFAQAAFGNFTILRKRGDNMPSPYVSEYEKICSKLQRFNLLNNGNFEDTLEANDTQMVKGWNTANGLTVSVAQNTPKSGSNALALFPNSFSQYLSQLVTLSSEPEEGKVTFGVWANGPESQAYITLRISTSDGHFYETYNISSNWMFYVVHGKVGKKGEAIEVCVFPDDGRCGESFSSIVIDGALLVYGDIPSIDDMISQSTAP